MPSLILQEEKIKHQHLLSVVIFCLNVHIIKHITSNFCTIYNSSFWVCVKKKKISQYLSISNLTQYVKPLS
jgi:hypothetical protein